MRKRYIAMNIVLVLFTVSFSGCPQSGSPAVGVWGFYLDDGCNAMSVTPFLVALYSSGDAEIYASEVVSGTWNLVGSTLAVTFPDLGSSAYVFAGTLVGDVVTNGTYTIDGMNNKCWTAQREVS
jgi:hypothetical protein